MFKRFWYLSGTDIQATNTYVYVCSELLCAEYYELRAGAVERSIDSTERFLVHYMRTTSTFTVRNR